MNNTYIDMYLNGDDYLYKEPEYENKVTSEELLEAFNNNTIVVVDNGIRYKVNAIGPDIRIRKSDDFGVYFTKCVLNIDSQTGYTAIESYIEFAKSYTNK